MVGRRRPSNSLTRSSIIRARQGALIFQDKAALQGGLTPPPEGSSAFVVKAKGDDPLYQSLLRDSNFFALLLRCDQDLADEVQQVGCAACGGALHRADYRRKPRGGPLDLRAELVVRRSFCCAVEGCRQRSTPPSLRFLGRKVYFGVAVLLLPMLMEGPTPRRLAQLQEVYGVSLRTLRRWRQWWRESFGTTRFFVAARAGFARSVAAGALPGGLFEAFSPMTALADRVVAILRFLLPVTGGSSSQNAPAFCGSPETRRRCDSTSG
jgi:hypothetical protein